MAQSKYLGISNPAVFSYPTTRSTDIVRSRLQRILQPERSHVTLVVAPAGHGKTTLLGQWRTELLAADLPVVWLSLQESVRNPDRFDSILMEALSEIGLQVDFEAPDGSPMIEQLELLKKDGQPGTPMSPFTVILDDYHLAESESANRRLLTLIENSPSVIHLIIGARIYPSLPLSHLRVSNQLTELTEEEIVFTPPEMVQFLEHTHGISLSHTEAGLLYEKSRGWIAGIQLAALLLKKYKGRERTVIEKFSGGIDQVSDYLAAEVFDGLTSHDRTFLMKTAILDRFNASVCDFICGRRDSENRLRVFEQMNLFLTPIGDGDWYRYHPLFRDFLIDRLKQGEPEAIPVLNGMAGEWSLKHNFLEDSVDYFLRAGDYQRAAESVENCAMKLVDDGQIKKLKSWLDNFPPELIFTRVRLATVNCWVLFHTRQWREGEQLLARIEMKISQGNGAVTGNDPTEMAVLKAGVMLARSHIADTIEFATAHLASNRCGDPFLWGTLCNILGAALLEVNRPDDAYRIADVGLNSLKLADCSYGIIVSLRLKAQADMSRGYIAEARQEVAQARAALKESSSDYCRGLVAITQGLLLYTTGASIGTAVSGLQSALPEIAAIGNFDFQRCAAEALAEMLAQQNRCSEALEVLRLYCEEMIVKDSLSQLSRLALAKVRVFLIAGDHHAAEKYADWLREQNLTGVLLCERDLVLTWLAVTSGEQEKAQQHLSVIATGVLPFWRQLEKELLQAWVSLLGNDKSNAVKCAATALLQWPPECALKLQSVGWVKALVDKLGAEVVKVLDQPKKDRIVRLLTSVNTGEADDRQARLTPPQATEFPLEPLTQRESALLQLLTQGYSNQAIADQMHLSLNTVKWHVRNILQKYGAQSRARVIALAKSAPQPPIE